MEEQETQIIEKSQDNRKRNLKWIGGIGTFVIISILIIIKLSKPEFQFKWIFYIGIPVLIIGLILFFGFDLYARWQKLLQGKKDLDDDKLPKSATSEEIEAEIDKFLLKRENHRDNIEEIIPFNLGKNEIYAYKIRLHHDDSQHGKIIFIIVNANFLKIKPFAILEGDANYNKIKTRANGLSSAPEPKGDIEESETIDPTTGKIHKYKKTTPNKKIEDKKKHPEEVA